MIAICEVPALSHSAAWSRQQSTPLMAPPLLMALHTPPGPSPMWMIVLPGQIESGHDGVTQPLPQQMGSPPQSPWQP